MSFPTGKHIGKINFRVLSLHGSPSSAEPLNFGRQEKKKIIVSVRAVDSDPHGSAFIFPPGSGADPGGENLREKTEKRKENGRKL